MTWGMQEIAAAVEEHRQDVGVVHLGLYGTQEGMVTSWRHHLEAVAEPSAHPASPFLQSQNPCSPSSFR